MSASLSVGQKIPFFIIGKDVNGVRTGALATGASLSVKVSDASLASITPDATPKTAPDGGPSITSGVLTALATGTETLSAQVTNADGTAGPSASDQVSISAAGGQNPATSLGFAYGTAA